MKGTSFKQMTLPPLALGTKDRVSAVATAPSDRSIRVLIRNPSAATCFFSTASESMIGPNAPGSEAYELGPDAEDIFVLPKGQSLFGCANAIGAMISISMSESLDAAGANL